MAMTSGRAWTAVDVAATPVASPTAEHHAASGVSYIYYQHTEEEKKGPKHRTSVIQGGVHLQSQRGDSRLRAPCGPQLHGTEKLNPEPLPRLSTYSAAGSGIPALSCASLPPVPATLLPALRQSAGMLLEPLPLPLLLLLLLAAVALPTTGAPTHSPAPESYASPAEHTGGCSVQSRAAASK